MNLPEKEPHESSPTSANSSSEPWANRWILDETRHSKGGNQSLVRAVRETEGNRRGALKTLKKPSHSERRARMVREVEILGKLEGVSEIPKVLDHNIFTSGEEPFVVLEWIDGWPLSEHFSDTVSIEKSAEIALKLCRAVQRCHERGIIHRDIKPDNILISGSGNDLWVVDFGIGWTESRDDPFATEINQELGNRFLRLPELHGPDPDSKHDNRSDVTFVCGVFFWLLTHSKPFQLTNEKMAAPHTAQANRFPQDVLSDPRWRLINSMFGVGFAPGVTLRFQTAAELFIRLKELLEPLPSSNTNDRLNEQDRHLIEFQNKAEVIYRRKIDQGILGASNLLLSKLTTMAAQRGLFSNSTGSMKANTDLVYLRFLLQLRHSDNQFSDVCHWILITAGKILC
jgi:serine/threonine protein kinase